MHEVPNGTNIFLIWQLMESMAGDYWKKTPIRQSRGFIHLCELTLSYAHYCLMHNCIIWYVWIPKYLQNCFKCLH